MFALGSWLGFLATMAVGPSPSGTGCADQALEDIVFHVDRFPTVQMAIVAAIAATKSEPVALLFTEGKEYRLAAAANTSAILSVTNAAYYPLRIDGCEDTHPSLPVDFIPKCLSLNWHVRTWLMASLLHPGGADRNG